MTTQARRPPHVDRGTSSYTELAHQVHRSGLMGRRQGYYWASFTTLLLVLALLAVAATRVGDSWWQLAVAAGVGVVLAQLGFLGHDAAHRQVFASSSWNDAAALVLAGAFTGLGLSWWKGKHNRHHAAPNQEQRDPDIAPGLLTFTPALAERRGSGVAGWFQRHQGWLFFPLLTLEGINLHVTSVRELTRRGRVRHRGAELTLVLTRHTAYIAALLLLLPPTKALCFVRAGGGPRAVPRWLLRPQPQGDADRAADHEDRLPPPPGADVAQRPGRSRDRHRDGRSELPGRAPPVPQHAPAEPQASAADRARLLPGARRVPYTELGLLASYAVVVRYLNDVGLRARGPFECLLAADLRSGAGRADGS